jgi:pectinesterase
MGTVGLSTITMCLIFIISGSRCVAQTKRLQVTVSANGKADYRSVQDAVNHIPADGAVIRIAPGIYKEKVVINQKNVSLVGLGMNPRDVLITYGDSAMNTGSTFKSGTVIVTADGFEAENLSIVNTWWDEHPDPKDASQAVALQLSSDRAIVDRVHVVSGQDTLFAASLTCRSNTEMGPCSASREYFNDCFIKGNVDYIFGDAKAVFDHCELHSRPHNTIMITAQSKHFTAEDSGYYFLGCKITGADNGDKVVLGRPWREYASVMFYDTDIEQKIAPEGWSEWGGRLKTASYREYRSHGPGMNGGNRIIEYPPLLADEEKNLTPGKLLIGQDSWEPKAEVRILRDLTH